MWDWGRQHRTTLARDVVDMSGVAGICVGCLCGRRLGSPVISTYLLLLLLLLQRK